MGSLLQTEEDTGGVDAAKPLRAARRWLSRLSPERKALLLVAAALLALLAVSLLLTLGERTADRSTIRAGSSYEVPLEEGDEVAVYLTAFDSIAFQFDVYPSDLTCGLVGPDGDQLAGYYQGGGRALDGWTRHDEVMTWTVEGTGAHRLTCIDHSDRMYEIVLATGEEAWRTPIEPLIVAWLGVLLVAPFWMLALVLSFLIRGALRLGARRRSKLEDSLRAEAEVDEVLGSGV